MAMLKYVLRAPYGKLSSFLENVKGIQISLQEALNVRVGRACQAEYGEVGKPIARRQE